MAQNCLFTLYSLYNSHAELSKAQIATVALVVPYAAMQLKPNLLMHSCLVLALCPRIMRQMAKKKHEREAVKCYETTILDRRGQIHHVIKYEKQVKDFIKECSWLYRRTSYPTHELPHLLRLSHLKCSLKSCHLHFQFFPELYPADDLKLVHDTIDIIQNLSNKMIPAHTWSRDLTTLQHTWS